jgi:hypothetical protein
MLTLVVIDTCALLDLIRSPVRDYVSHTYIDSALQLLARLKELQSTVRLVYPDIVQDEYRRNVEDVHAETDKLIRRMRDGYAHALAVITRITDQPAQTIVDFEWLKAGVVGARQLADDFLAIGTLEPTVEDDHLGAYRRVMTATPPSRRGKESTADCTITEFAVRLSRRGREHGVAKTILFSSNTQEYCDGGRLKADLQTEFDSCGLQYARTWGEACHSALGGHMMA